MSSYLTENGWAEVKPDTPSGIRKGLSELRTVSRGGARTPQALATYEPLDANKKPA